MGRIDRGKYRGRPTIRAVKAKDSHDYQIEIDEFNNPVLVRSRRTAEEFPMSDLRSSVTWQHSPIPLACRICGRSTGPAGCLTRCGSCGRSVWSGSRCRSSSSKYPQGRNDIRDSINDAVKKAKATGYLTVPQEAAVEAIEMASSLAQDFDAAIKGLQEECFIAIRARRCRRWRGT